MGEKYDIDIHRQPRLVLHKRFSAVPPFIAKTELAKIAGAMSSSSRTVWM
jgi:hypothetical protein